MTTTNPLRENGKVALGTILNIIKNITVIEKYIFEAAISSSEDEDVVEENYNEYLYQIIGDILAGNKLKSTLANIKSKKLGWNHSSFDEFSFRLREQDDFIMKPFEIEEGILQCNCGSKRVFSFAKQVRSSDEGTSIFAECVACKAKWVC